MPFRLTPRQQEAVELLGGAQRYTQLEGGSRSGKTFVLMRALCYRALRVPQSRHAIFRLHYNAARSSIWLDTLPKVMRLCFAGQRLVEHRRDGYVAFANGSQIWFGGLDEQERVEKVLGQEYSTIYFNECSQIPYASVLVALTRLAATLPGLRQRAYYDLNPVGTGHWTYRLFHEQRDPDSRAPLADPENYRWLRLNPLDNQANLDAAYLRDLQHKPERIRRRFFLGQYVAEISGALWTHEGLERCRVSAEQVPELLRIAIGIDPSGCEGPEDKRSDRIGIVVAGLGVNGHCYVLADRTVQDGPGGWGRAAALAYADFQADCFVGERNFGGAMVKFVLRTARPDAKVLMVSASRGKTLRAEPVATLYDYGKVHHVGRLDELEDQLAQFSTAGWQGERSPDAADALVHVVTELMLRRGVERPPTQGVSALPIFLR